MGKSNYPEPRGRSPFEAAKRKGEAARRDGESQDANPYGDNRTRRGGVTFARAWRRAWDEGWLGADALRPHTEDDR